MHHLIGTGDRVWPLSKEEPSARPGLEAKPLALFVSSPAFGLKLEGKAWLARDGVK